MSVVNRVQYVGQLVAAPKLVLVAAKAGVETRPIAHRIENMNDFMVVVSFRVGIATVHAFRTPSIV